MKRTMKKPMERREREGDGLVEGVIDKAKVVKRANWFGEYMHSFWKSDFKTFT